MFTKPDLQRNPSRVSFRSGESQKAAALKETGAKVVRPVTGHAPPQMELCGALDAKISAKNFTRDELNKLNYGKASLETIQAGKISSSEWVEALIYSDLSFCSDKLFRKVLQNEEILSKVSMHVMNLHNDKPEIIACLDRTNDKPIEERCDSDCIAGESRHGDHHNNSERGPKKK